MRRSQSCRKIEEAGLQENFVGRNNSISKGPGAGKASSVSVLSWEGCKTSRRDERCYCCLMDRGEGPQPHVS